MSFLKWMVLIVWNVACIFFVISQYMAAGFWIALATAIALFLFTGIVMRDQDLK